MVERLVANQIMGVRFSLPAQAKSGVFLTPDFVLLGQRKQTTLLLWRIEQRNMCELREYNELCPVALSVFASLETIRTILPTRLLFEMKISYGNRIFQKKREV